MSLATNNNAYCLWNVYVPDTVINAVPALINPPHHSRKFYFNPKHVALYSPVIHKAKDLPLIMSPLIKTPLGFRHILHL